MNNLIRNSILAVIALFFLSMSQAGAATITVDTTTDDNTTNGNCTLREAIISVNGSIFVDACTDATTDGLGVNDTIVLATDIYTMSLTGTGEDSSATGDLDITKSVIVNGNGATIDANNTDRVCQVIGGGVTVVINNLTIKNGDSGSVWGGGILSNGILTINDSTISDNSSAVAGGGIVNNGGALTINESTISGNAALNEGGGVFNYTNGSTTLTNSTVSGNSTTNNSGGGINNWGALNIDSSSISGNTAYNRGGGVFNYTNGSTTLTNSTVSGNSTTNDSGGGIFNTGALTLTDTTVSGNAATNQWAGGIFNDDGTMAIYSSTINGNSDILGVGGVMNQGTATFVNSTISGNDGTGIRNSSVGVMNSVFTNCTIASNTGTGYYHAGTVTIYSTIVANNGTDCTDSGIGGFTDAGWNLDSDNTCTFTDATDLPGTNPVIGPLQDNDGPTQTHALLKGSPAIDAGDNIGSPATDQRGVTRPQDGDDDGTAICDIGSYELEATSSGGGGGCFIATAAR